jgi:hypothetical protein
MQTSGKNLKVFMYETHDYMDPKPERVLRTEISQRRVDDYISTMRDSGWSGTISNAKELTPAELVSQRNDPYWRGFERNIDCLAKDCTEEFYEEYMRLLK